MSKLLGCGARHDLHSTLGWTALHWACIKDSDGPLPARRPNSVQTVPRSQEQPCAALTAGHVESLKLLLKHGVDVNAHSVASKSLQSQASRLHLTANTALMNVRPPRPWVPWRRLTAHDGELGALTKAKS